MKPGISPARTKGLSPEAPMKSCIMKFAIVLVASLSLTAQSPQATVSGTVTDPQGAFIIHADVAALNLQTGVETLAQTNDSFHAGLQVQRRDIGVNDEGAL